jgi:hypothetical protein
VIVTLSPVWLEKAIAVGKAIAADCIQNNQVRYGNGPDNPLSYTVNGCVAEAAVAKHFRLKWTPEVGKINAIDVGGVIEVRSRPIPGPGLDLGIRPHDKRDLPHVLAWVYADYRVELVGWLYGREGMNHPTRWHEACGCWWNPPPYRSLDELAELLK